MTWWKKVIFKYEVQTGWNWIVIGRRNWRMHFIVGIRGGDLLTL